MRLAVLVDGDEHLVGFAEEVVEIPEDVLVRPHQAHADVIGIVVLERVQGQRFLDVAQVDELLDLPV